MSFNGCHGSCTVIEKSFLATFFFFSFSFSVVWEGQDKGEQCLVWYGFRTDNTEFLTETVAKSSFAEQYFVLRLCASSLLPRFSNSENSTGTRCKSEKCAHLLYDDQRNNQ